MNTPANMEPQGLACKQPPTVLIYYLPAAASNTAQCLTGAQLTLFCFHFHMVSSFPHRFFQQQQEGFSSFFHGRRQLDQTERQQKG